MVETCREYAPRLADGQFFSHGTALLLIGAPGPSLTDTDLHVSTHRPAREPRVVGVVGHRLQMRQPATIENADGLRVEHPVRAWRQAATHWPLDALIAAGDFLVSSASLEVKGEDLRDEVELMGDTRSGILRRALRDVRAGVRSAKETELRLALVRSGLPEPVVAFVLREVGGRFVAELDLAYPRWQIGVEYDGRIHELDGAQFAKDADRWDRIRHEGWVHVRIMRHHMRGNHGTAVAKVRDALRSAGWHPGL